MKIILILLMSCLTPLVANAGGGDYEYHQEALNTAYVQQTALPQTEVLADEFQPDKFDKVYVWLRSFIPDWVLLSFMAIGAITMGIVTFKKQVSGLLTAWGEILNKKT